MMGSGRGDSAPHTTALAQLTAAMTPSQASTVAALYDLFELLQNSSPLLSAAVKDLRSAEEAARGAAADLEKTVEEHTDRGVALAARTIELDHAAGVLADREAACQDREAATARKQASFDGMDAKFAVWAQDLNQRTQALAGDRAALDADRQRHATDQEAKATTLSEEATRLRLEGQAAVMAMQVKAAAEIDQMRATVIADIAAQREQVDRDAAKLSAREEAFHSERNRLSALLKE